MIIYNYSETSVNGEHFVFWIQKFEFESQISPFKTFWRSDGVPNT